MSLTNLEKELKRLSNPKRAKKLKNILKQEKGSMEREIFLRKEI